MKKGKYYLIIGKMATRLPLPIIGWKRTGRMADGVPEVVPIYKERTAEDYLWGNWIYLNHESTYKKAVIYRNRDWNTTFWTSDQDCHKYQIIERQIDDITDLHKPVTEEELSHAKELAEAFRDAEHARAEEKTNEKIYLEKCRAEYRASQAAANKAVKE